MGCWSWYRWAFLPPSNAATVDWLYDLVSRARVLCWRLCRASSVASQAGFGRVGSGEPRLLDCMLAGLLRHPPLDADDEPGAPLQRALSCRQGRPAELPAASHPSSAPLRRVDALLHALLRLRLVAPGLRLGHHAAGGLGVALAGLRPHLLGALHEAGHRDRLGAGPRAAPRATGPPGRLLPVRPKPAAHVDGLGIGPWLQAGHLGS